MHERENLAQILAPRVLLNTTQIPNVTRVLNAVRGRCVQAEPSPFAYYLSPQPLYPPALRSRNWKPPGLNRHHDVIYGAR